MPNNCSSRGEESQQCCAMHAVAKLPFLHCHFSMQRVLIYMIVLLVLLVPPTMEWFWASQIRLLSHLFCLFRPHRVPALQGTPCIS